MFRPLRRVTLKTGERLRVGALRAPAGRYANAIRQFLDHKGRPWLDHIELANRGETDDLQTTYYVGLLDRKIVGNIMIVSDGRAGILGHVFTDPEHRRKGICQALMAAAVGDFRDSGGLALSLGTGYDSSPYWIYHSFGFRGIEPGNGHMLFESREGDLARYFAPGPARVSDVRWAHWAGVSLLYMQPNGDQIRSYAYAVFGPVGFEGGFLNLQADRAKSVAQARVLATRQGAVVGAAILQPDRKWPGRVYTLDLFVHPNFRGTEARLLRALELPADCKVQAFLDRPSASRVAALRAAGFRREATLKSQLDRLGSRTDVFVFGH